jgi:LEA14-like dessication related protein
MMDANRRSLIRRTTAAAAALVLASPLAGCAILGDLAAPRVTVVGVDRLAGEGFELRLNVKLRVQNPNPREIDYDGLAIDLDVNGRPLATGVSPAKGTIGRFGETVLTVPVTVNAVAAVRQMLGLADGVGRGELPYAIRGRLGGNPISGGMRFSSEGVLRLAP